jgi:murein DD-endopeptidase MepM/ murein hydrolase activator NlpD
MKKTTLCHILALVITASTILSCGGGGGSSNGNSEYNTEAVDTPHQSDPTKLGWPIDCIIGETCSSWIGFPDLDGDWVAFNCGYPGYPFHTGTDISDEYATIGIAIFAAAAGQVAWVLDGKYDNCQQIDTDPADCHEPTAAPGPNVSSGYMSCTESRPEYCEGSGQTGSCYWCSYGGNEIVIRHHGIPGVFATRYDHLRMNSMLVRPGDWVTKGQKIAEMGSAGYSPAPHLHFEVWGSGYNQVVDPWAGACGPNTSMSLWDPWIQQLGNSGNAEEDTSDYECDENSCWVVGWP